MNDLREFIYSRCNFGYIIMLLTRRLSKTSISLLAFVICQVKVLYTAMFIVFNNLKKCSELKS